ncbi:hypothetical protein ANTPLA_LOCUS10660 [Anthophora plagiata]
MHSLIVSNSGTFAEVYKVACRRLEREGLVGEGCGETGEGGGREDEKRIRRDNEDKRGGIRRTGGPGILDSVVEGTAAVMLCKMELINKDSERRASNFPILRKTIL